MGVGGCGHPLTYLTTAAIFQPTPFNIYRERKGVARITHTESSEAIQSVPFSAGSGDTVISLRCPVFGEAPLEAECVEGVLVAGPLRTGLPRLLLPLAAVAVEVLSLSDDDEIGVEVPETGW